jgi:hypothetical protein
MATSRMHENLVQCDVSSLNVPDYNGALCALKSESPKQISFADSVRTDKMREWRADLPGDVYAAIRGIDDATWWLANKDNDSTTIKWPKSWVAPLPEPPATAAPAPRVAPSPDLQERLANLRRPLGQPAKPSPAQAQAPPAQAPPAQAPPAQAPPAFNGISDDQAANFEAFARKACRSPELAYLTIMALRYRQTRDQRVLAKFQEARKAVAGHLEAIDRLCLI